MNAVCRLAPQASIPNRDSRVDLLRFDTFSLLVSALADGECDVPNSRSSAMQQDGFHFAIGHTAIAADPNLHIRALFRKDVGEPSGQFRRLDRMPRQQEAAVVENVDCDA